MSLSPATQHTIRRKVGNGSVLMETEYRKTRFPDPLCLSYAMFSILYDFIFLIKKYIKKHKQKQHIFLIRYLDISTSYLIIS